MIKTLALNGKALLTNNKELGWDNSFNGKLYYESLPEITGATKIITGINITEYPYLVIKYDFKTTAGSSQWGAGGAYFNFGDNVLNTRNHTYYYRNQTSIYETNTSQLVNIIDSSCTEISLDGRHNYFADKEPINYHTHAYLVNISTNYVKVYFDKVYSINTTYPAAFNTFEYWQITQEVYQIPTIKNIYVYGFATEEEAIDFIVNGTLNK